MAQQELKSVMLKMVKIKSVIITSIFFLALILIIGTAFIQNGNLNITGNFTGNHYYGEMNIGNSTTDTEIADADAWFNVSGFSLGNANSFSLVRDDALKADKAGLYMAQHSASFSGQPNVVYHTSLAVNNNQNLKCQARRKLGAAGDLGNAGAHCLLQLSKDDEVSLQVLNCGGTGNVLFEEANIMLFRIGS